MIGETHIYFCHRDDPGNLLLDFSVCGCTNASGLVESETHHQGH